MEKNKKNEELQSRREFFKKAAKSALPILSAIVLVGAPAIVKAAETSVYCGGCKNDCTNGCRNGCHRSCGSSCGLGCRGTSSAYGPRGCETCRTYCSSCSGQCSGTCSGSCSVTSYTV